MVLEKPFLISFVDRLIAAMPFFQYIGATGHSPFPDSPAFNFRERQKECRHVTACRHWHMDIRFVGWREIIIHVRLGNGCTRHHRICHDKSTTNKIAANKVRQKFRLNGLAINKLTVEVWCTLSSAKPSCLSPSWYLSSLHSLLEKLKYNKKTR